MKKVKFCWHLLAVALFFSGCVYATKPEKPLVSVVTGVRVTYDHDPFHTQQILTKQDKIQTVLNYLRNIQPYGRPEEDPETVPGSLWEITLYFSDGSQRCYRQKADRYMKEGDAPWKRIDSGKAKRLAELLGNMESDAPAAR